MEFKLINPNPKYSRARLVEPPTRGYLHLAAAVDAPTEGRFPSPSKEKSDLIDRLKDLARQVERLESVAKATVYQAVIVPTPSVYGQQKEFRQPRYDVAVLVETNDVDALEAVGKSEEYQALRDAVTAATSDTHEFKGHCLESLGEVDVTRPGLFLFNYNVSEDPKIALRTWEYCYGWFQAEADLNNATLLEPDSPSDYAYLSYARFDLDLPSFVELISKPSMGEYISTNLLANRVGSMPVLYDLV
ncbi:hypothetical protein [Streptomyces sp. NPDC046909]|uniref:hypothetical protein n=1 Tax=Streptomyces sp. NPDC046909 TaxID=3155617 RepID=UPI0033BFFBE3